VETYMTDNNKQTETIITPAISQQQETDTYDQALKQGLVALATQGASQDD
jgi:hypothetical protein